MLPGIYGFAWDSGHIVFLGIFYAVVTVVLSTVGLAVLKTARAAGSPSVERLRWRADFDDLPSAARRCRHELCGEVARRTCENAFDCRTCAGHARFATARAAAATAPSSRLGAADVAGFRVPDDRLYHRGHTWVRRERDGSLTVGLDDLGAHLMGRPDELELPRPGTRVTANGTAWRARRKGVSVRVLAPVDGEVVAVGGPTEGWYLRVAAADPAQDLGHLLDAAEARPWMVREVERLQLALADDAVGAALADGGAPAEGFADGLSPAQLDEACGAVFLEP